MLGDFRLCLCSLTVRASGLRCLHSEAMAVRKLKERPGESQCCYLRGLACVARSLSIKQFCKEFVPNVTERIECALTAKPDRP